MSDRRIRELERLASQGDQEAHARWQRHMCSLGEHEWASGFLTAGCYASRTGVWNPRVHCLACEHTAQVPHVANYAVLPSPQGSLLSWHPQSRPPSPWRVPECPGGNYHEPGSVYARGDEYEAVYFLGCGRCDEAEVAPIHWVPEEHSLNELRSTDFWIQL